MNIALRTNTSKTINSVPRATCRERKTREEVKQTNSWISDVCAGNAQTGKETVPRTQNLRADQDYRNRMEEALKRRQAQV